MKTISAVIFALLVPTCAYSDSLKKAAELEVLRLDSGSDLTKRSMQYFEIFPGNFEEFVDLFGYQEITFIDTTTSINKTVAVFAPLYDPSYDNVAFFMKTASYVGVERFSEKLLNLLRGGYWQSDGVSSLKFDALNHISDNLDFYVEKFVQMDKSEFQMMLLFLESTAPGGQDLTFDWLRDAVCEKKVGYCGLPKNSDASSQ